MFVSQTEVQLRADKQEGALTEALENAWQTISAGLRRDLGAQIFGQWIRPMKLSRFEADAGQLHLICPSEFAANWVRDRYLDRLTLAWKAHHPAVKALSFTVKTGAARIASVKNSAAAEVQQDILAAQNSKFRLDLDPRMTFDEFIAGNSNILALNASQRMAAAEKPLSIRFTCKARRVRAKHISCTPSAMLTVPNFLLPESSICRQSGL